MTTAQALYAPGRGSATTGAILECVDSGERPGRLLGGMLEAVNRLLEGRLFGSAEKFATAILMQEPGDRFTGFAACVAS